jgi:hypothetical protein
LVQRANATALPTASPIQCRSFLYGSIESVSEYKGSNIVAVDCRTIFCMIVVLSVMIYWKDVDFDLAYKSQKESVLPCCIFQHDILLSELILFIITCSYVKKLISSRHLLITFAGENYDTSIELR